MTEETIHIAVTIPTCKRPQGLARLLASLDQQQVSTGLRVSIIVVDNAPNAATRSVAEQWTGRFELQYLEESVAGIVAVRNRCFREVLNGDADYLLFIDDDEYPERDDWLQAMVDAARRFEADIVAGPVIAELPEGAPSWIGAVMYRRSSNKTGDSLSTFYTGNLLLSRRILEIDSAPFDDRFSQSGGSDYHFALRCLRRGLRAVHCDAACVEVFPESRANVGWLMKRGFRSGSSWALAHRIEDGLMVTLVKGTGFALVRILRGVLGLVLGAMTLSKIRLVTGLFRLASGFGTLAGIGGFRSREYAAVHGD